ncbi:MAG: tRNA threonylcarbamoyladenosine biosynthesis protein TsaE [Chlamydiae bacterium]|nr:tRNA threonylcarbamoyladenosine biosynthesis protein TsaE [Chlamydiota bacterium]
MIMKSYELNSVEETLSFGQDLAKQLPEGSILCFEGDLASGKTTMIKGIVSGMMDYPQDQVNSPTFVYLNIYEGDRIVYHFDLYRLEDPDEFLAMGFDELLDEGGVTCCIEWPERMAPYLPKPYIKVKLEHLGENRRLVTVLECGHEKI